MSVMTDMARAIDALTHRFLDLSDFNGRRLHSIENRLAELDGRGDSEAAQQAALSGLIEDRVRSGGEAPTLILDNGEVKVRAKR